MLRNASTITRPGAHRLDERCLRLTLLVVVLAAAGVVVQVGAGVADAGTAAGALAPVVLVVLLWAAARVARDRR